MKTFEESFSLVTHRDRNVLHQDMTKESQARLLGDDHQYRDAVAAFACSIVSHDMACNNLNCPGGVMLAFSAAVYFGVLIGMEMEKAEAPADEPKRPAAWLRPYRMRELNHGFFVGYCQHCDEPAEFVRVRITPEGRAAALSCTRCHRRLDAPDFVTV